MALVICFVVLRTLLVCCVIPRSSRTVAFVGMEQIELVLLRSSRESPPNAAHMLSNEGFLQMNGLVKGPEDIVLLPSGSSHSTFKFGAHLLSQ